MVTDMVSSGSIQLWVDSPPHRQGHWTGAGDAKGEEKGVGFHGEAAAPAG